MFITTQRKRQVQTQFTDKENGGEMTCPNLPCDWELLQGRAGGFAGM